MLLKIVPLMLFSSYLFSIEPSTGAIVSLKLADLKQWKEEHDNPVILLLHTSGMNVLSLLENKLEEQNKQVPRPRFYKKEDIAKNLNEFFKAVDGGKVIYEFIPGPSGVSIRMLAQNEMTIEGLEERYGKEIVANARALATTYNVKK